MKQFTFYSTAKRAHGGDHSVKKRRARRPLNIKQSVHLTLRSDLAKGKRSLLKNKQIVLYVLGRFAKRFRVRVYEKAICGNHIHLLVKAQTRKEVQNFFRVLAGQIAQAILCEHPLSNDERRQRGGTQSGCQKNRRTFWSLLIYSRLVSWGREFRAVRAYVLLNMHETLGVVTYKPRVGRYPLGNRTGVDGS